MQILICGDSFAADWTVKYSGQGWPNLLAKQYNVVNLAQAGCSEYKILKQLESVDVSEYDCVIVSHTSPYRIYVAEHPVHHNDILHKNCDLIYTDLKEHVIKNKKLAPIIDYFENYFDTKHAKDMHKLVCEKIDSYLKHVTNRVIHITNLNYETLYEFKNMINFEYLFASNRGLMNHYDDEGNKKIFQAVSDAIKLIV